MTWCVGLEGLWVGLTFRSNSGGLLAVVCVCGGGGGGGGGWGLAVA